MTPTWRRWLPVLVLTLAGTVVYRNSLSGAFVFDDWASIVNNPHLRALWPPREALSTQEPRGPVDGRPVVAYSLALNYAAGGLEPRGYHVANFLIHLAAGLLLFGIVRRTLGEPGEAPWLALGTAAVWLVHPLQTGSVTYIAQRAESLMGLFYLLTMYAALRNWKVLTVLACALGMATKEVMVTAPLAVLLYDRAYRAGSFREAFRLRKGLHLALAATWLVLAACVASTPTSSDDQFLFPPVPPVTYLLSESGVILHYLKLILWPGGLVLDYAWPPAQSAKDWLPQGLALLALLVPTLWALWRNHPLGFPAFFFFLVLAPTSSVMPLKDLAFEHRLYLPLAAVAALALLGGRRLAARLGLGIRVQGLLLLLAVAGLGGATVLRNRDYRSELALWSDTVSKRPSNPRARCLLGSLLMFRDPDRAVAHLREAIRLKPDFAAAHRNLGYALMMKGDQEGAGRALAEARRLNPEDPLCRFSLERLARLRQARAPHAPGDPPPGPGPGPPSP